MPNSLHDQIGIDLAKHAGDRASKVMLEAFSLCETPEQAKMVALEVVGTIAAQAAGAFVAGTDMNPGDLSASELLSIMADLMKEVDQRRARKEQP